MRLTILLIIKIYQILLSPFQVLFPAAGCRFYPTCSIYTHNAVERYGAAKGLKMGIIRVLKCNPWS